MKSRIKKISQFTGTDAIEVLDKLSADMKGSVFTATIVDNNKIWTVTRTVQDVRVVNGETRVYCKEDFDSGSHTHIRYYSIGDVLTGLPQDIESTEIDIIKNVTVGDNENVTEVDQVLHSTDFNVSPDLDYQDQLREFEKKTTHLYEIKPKAEKDNIIRLLKGYHSETPALHIKGIVVGHGGKSFNINDLDSVDVSPKAMARCSARESRYNGNTEKFFSLAQHCCMGAMTFLIMGRPDLAARFMVHDGSEIILRDMTKPIKDLLPDYEALQDKFDRFVARIYGFEYPYPPEIKMIDKNCAQYEMSLMLREFVHDEYWTPEEAETKYLNMWDRINTILKYYK